MHLYVTPSHLVLITGAVILGIVGLIALIIAVLHLKEKVGTLVIEYFLWVNCIDYHPLLMTCCGLSSQ